MTLYTFNVENVRIDNTRSRHDDTDTVAATVAIGVKTHSATASLGDINNGSYPVDLKFAMLVADPAASIALSYAIYNGNTGSLPQTLTALTDTASQNALDDILDPSPPTSGPSDYGSGPDGGDPWNEPGSANVGWLTALSYLGLADFVFPDCDGFVAVDAIGNTIKQWDQAIDSSGGKLYRKRVRYPGSASPAGCGSNSDYTVIWSIAREAVSGSLRQFLKAHNLRLNPGVHSLN
jgi:hypothetical protein